MSLLLSDASPLVGFVAASRHGLMWDVLSRTHGRLEVAYQVDDEVARRAKVISRRAFTNYDWMRRNGQVVVLPEVQPFGGDPVVVRTVEQLLDSRALLSNRTKDLGEAVTIGHARSYRKSGTVVEVLIDDGGGVKWAEDHGLTVRSTVWVFEEAIARGFLATAADLKAAYGDAAKHARLPRLGNTALLALVGT